MEPIKVEFMFDFGSPNAYLAEKVIPDIERRTGVKFEYVPVLLGGIYKLTNNRSPAEYLAGIKNKPEFMQLEMERFIRRHNITSFREKSVFPGKHTAADARGGCCTSGGSIRALFPRCLSSHVGRAKEDGRPAGRARGVPIIERRLRSAICTRAAARCERSLAETDAGRRGSWCVRLADILRWQRDVFWAKTSCATWKRRSETLKARRQRSGNKREPTRDKSSREKDVDNGTRWNIGGRYSCRPSYA